MPALDLLHSPAEIVSQTLIDLGEGTDPELSVLGQWPVNVDAELSNPDNVVTVYDTTRQSDGRAMFDGEEFHHYGIQIRVRSSTHKIGYAKADSIHHTLSQAVLDHTVTLDIGSPTEAKYNVQSIAQTSLLRLGKESPSSQRRLYTVNCFASIRRLS